MRRAPNLVDYMQSDTAPTFDQLLLCSIDNACAKIPENNYGQKRMTEWQGLKTSSPLREVEHPRIQNPFGEDLQNELTSEKR